MLITVRREKQASSMIHSVRPTVSSVANIVFTLFYFAKFWTCAKTIIPTGRDCGLAEWINFLLFVGDDLCEKKYIFSSWGKMLAIQLLRHSWNRLTTGCENRFSKIQKTLLKTCRQTGLSCHKPGGALVLVTLL